MKIFEIPRFCSKFSTISILDKIFEKSPFSSKCLNRLDFDETLVNIDCGQNYRKIAILVKMFESLDFSEAFRHTSISVKILENHSLGQNFRKIAILIKIGENFKIFGKSRFYTKHLDFGANIRQSRFWSNLLKNLD